MIIQLMMAFISTFCFSIFFNAPKDKLVYCGITGSLGWGMHQLVIYLTGTDVPAIFLATIFIAMMSRYFAFTHKQPVTIFLIPGIIPLVPGAGVYYTMYSVFLNDLQNSLYQGVETLKIAGSISLGIIFVLALPSKLFIILASFQKITKK